MKLPLIIFEAFLLSKKIPNMLSKITGLFLKLYLIKLLEIFFIYIKQIENNIVISETITHKVSHISFII